VGSEELYARGSCDEFEERAPLKVQLELIDPMSDITVVLSASMWNVVLEELET